MKTTTYTIPQTVALAKTSAGMNELRAAGIAGRLTADRVKAANPGVKFAQAAEAAVVKSASHASAKGTPEFIPIPGYVKLKIAAAKGKSATAPAPAKAAPKAKAKASAKPAIKVARAAAPKIAAPAGTQRMVKAYLRGDALTNALVVDGYKDAQARLQAVGFAGHLMVNVYAFPLRGGSQQADGAKKGVYGCTVYVPASILSVNAEADVAAAIQGALGADEVATFEPSDEEKVARTFACYGIDGDFDGMETYVHNA